MSAPSATRQAGAPSRLAADLTSYRDGTAVAPGCAMLRCLKSPAILALLLAATGACDDSASPADQPTPADAGPESAERRRTGPLPKEVHWQRNSAERVAVTVQTYADATRRLPDLLPEDEETPWAVVLDVDETVLDNNELEFRRATLPKEEAGTFTSWVREAAAPAIPGAVAFTEAVHELGGHVAIVTNRPKFLCGPTRKNLKKADIVADIVICRPTKDDDKTPRWESIEDGSADDKLPPLEIVMYVGDNIHDFPGLSQETRFDGEEGVAEFATRFVLIPNPMYGSWEDNDHD